MKTQSTIPPGDQDEGDSDSELKTFEGARIARRVKNPKKNEKAKKISTGKLHYSHFHLERLYAYMLNS